MSFSVWALLAGAAALALPGAATAQSRVGVTSATDGDPLGKPPAQAERVLKIGIDVQANEVVTTRANDRAHLVFLDGSSLTVGPNAQLTIDKFVYDPNTKTGELALTTTQGVFRLVGGKISKNNAIMINTPSSTIGIRGGITIFNVSPGRTVANFIFGNSMTVTGQGQVQQATRPGSQVIVNAGAPPSPPTLLPPGGLTALVNQLENGSSSTSSSSSSSTSSKADAGAQNLGNSSGQNQPPAATPGGLPPNTNNNAITNAVNNNNGATNPTTPPFTPPTTVTTQTQAGFTNGLIVGGTGGTSTTRVPAIDNNTPSDFSITTTASGGTGTTAVQVIIRGLDGTLTSPTATLPLGGTTSNSTFFNDSNYSTKDLARPGTVQTAGGSTTLLQIKTELTSVVANQQVPPPPDGPGPVSPVIPQGNGGSGQCVCEFLKFGYWSSTISYNGTYRNGQQDVITNAPFVAGTVGSAPQLPNTQKITYDGFMYGSVQNGANSRMASGPWSLNWDMSRSAGTIRATYDGMNISGAAALTPGTANITGSMQSTSGGSVSGPLSGAFFSSPSNPANYVAGTYGLTGTKGGSTYLSGGIFAAQPKVPSP